MEMGNAGKPAVSWERPSLKQFQHFHPINCQLGDETEEEM
jgi:hypothetical protein